MIKVNDVKRLLNEFDLGSPTAENDPLLEAAKIETQVFYDLYIYDRIDIIRGIKGAGKTALYRLCNFLENYFIEKSNLFCVFGIEASGDPIFRLFQSDFEKYSEIEFENFWNIYFITLVYNLINTKKEIKQKFRNQMKAIDEILDGIGIKVSKDGFTLKDSVLSIQKILLSSNVKFGVQTEFDASNPMITKISPIVEIQPQEQKQLSKKPIYIADFRDKLKDIIEKCGIKIWIMIDRLDEVFPQHSEMEKKGLKGLLKSAYNISSPFLRVKIFIRDDIIEFLARGGFSALTQVIARCSATISWAKDDLLLLITKRICAINALKEYYQIEEKRLDEDLAYRKKVFDQLFPIRIGTMNTFDWLYASCSDSNGIVTPRDLIDFFRYAKAEQLKKYYLSPKEQDDLIQKEIFPLAIGELSKHKKETFLDAEFPHLRDSILQFTGKSSELDESDIHGILGDNYKSIIDELKSIGFIKHVLQTGKYVIPNVWRKSLNIKRKKKKKGTKMKK